MPNNLEKKKKKELNELVSSLIKNKNSEEKTNTFAPLHVFPYNQ